MTWSLVSYVLLCLVLEQHGLRLWSWPLERPAAQAAHYWRRAQHCPPRPPPYTTAPHQPTRGSCQIKGRCLCCVTASSDLCVFVLQNSCWECERESESISEQWSSNLQNTAGDVSGDHEMFLQCCNMSSLSLKLCSSSTANQRKTLQL